MSSLWCRVCVALSMVCVPAAALAAEAPGRIELGVVPLDFSVLSSGGETEELLSVPGGAYFGMTRGVFLQWLVTDKVAIEPQASAAVLFHDGKNVRSIQLGLRGNFLVKGAERPSPYLFAGGGLSHMGSSGNDSENDPLISVGAGYRQPIRSMGSVRVEVGY